MPLQAFRNNRSHITNIKTPYRHFPQFEPHIYGEQLPRLPKTTYLPRTTLPRVYLVYDSSNVPWGRPGKVISKLYQDVPFISAELAFIGQSKCFCMTKMLSRLAELTALTGRDNREWFWTQNGLSKSQSVHEL